MRLAVAAKEGQDLGAQDGWPIGILFELIEACLSG
jgi:hypothetical protein